MGHKVNPQSMRIKITDTWRSRWFARGKKFAEDLHQDNLIREMVQKKLARSGLVRVDIERLHREIIASLEAESVKRYFADAGIEAAGSSPAEFAAYFRDERDRWARVIKDTGAKIE